MNLSEKWKCRLSTAVTGRWKYAFPINFPLIFHHRWGWWASFQLRATSLNYQEKIVVIITTEIGIGDDTAFSCTIETERPTSIFWFYYIVEEDCWGIGKWRDIETGAEASLRLLKENWISLWLVQFFPLSLSFCQWEAQDFSFDPGNIEYKIRYSARIPRIAIFSFLFHLSWHSLHP